MITKYHITMDKLCFYSKSRDVKPGKGTNEFVNDATDYMDLASVKDWRKILSNFHVSPFTYNGYTYMSIEHAFQAKKIELADKETALYFTLESGHDIGRSGPEIARKNRKIIKLSKEQLAQWSQIRDEVMYEAAQQKYAICYEAAKVLKATHSAELWHIAPRSKPVRFEHLEKIRTEI
jgi:ribA/ribD-fused uncharacterized protein